MSFLNFECKHLFLDVSLVKYIISFVDSGNRNPSLYWNLHIHFLRSTKR